MVALISVELNNSNMLSLEISYKIADIYKMQTYKDTMPKYDKLIRDKIPEIIESQEKRCEVEVMDDAEFATYLKKLQEEVD